MSDELPAPLTPADCNLSDFKFMPLDVARFRNSDLALTMDPATAFAAVLLWAASWHQVPAASLPDDDRSLAQLAGFGRFVEQWQAIRADALRGFVKCSDGRLYHKVVSEKALEAWAAKQAQRERTAAARKAAAMRRAQSQGDGDGENDQLQSEGRVSNRGGEKSVTASKGQGQGQGQGQEDRLNEGDGKFDRAKAFAKWNERLPAILAECPKIDPTSTSIRNLAPLLALEAEGCDADLDIVPAIVAVAKGWTGRKLIFSWTLDAFAEVAHGNRELRAKGGSPNAKPRRNGRGASGLAGARERRLARTADSDDHGRAEPQSASDAFKAKFGDSDCEDDVAPLAGQG